MNPFLLEIYFFLFESLFFLSENYLMIPRFDVSTKSMMY